MDTFHPIHRVYFHKRREDFSLPLARGGEIITTLREASTSPRFLGIELDGKPPPRVSENRMGKMALGRGIEGNLVVGAVEVDGN